MGVAKKDPSSQGSRDPEVCSLEGIKQPSPLKGVIDAGIWNKMHPAVQRIFTQFIDQCEALGLLICFKNSNNRLALMMGKSASRDAVVLGNDEISLKQIGEMPPQRLQSFFNHRLSTEIRYRLGNEGQSFPLCNANNLESIHEIISAVLRDNNILQEFGFREEEIAKLSQQPIDQLVQLVHDTLYVAISALPGERGENRRQHILEMGGMTMHDPDIGEGSSIYRNPIIVIRALRRMFQS